MKRLRLFWRIYLPALLIIVAALVAITWTSAATYRNFYYAQMQEDILNRALLVAPHVRSLLSANSAVLQEFCRNQGRRTNTRITVIAPDGTVLADSNEDPVRMDNHGRRPEVIEAHRKGRGSSFRFSRTVHKTMLYVAIPLDREHPAASGILRLSVPATSLDRVLDRLTRKIGLEILAVGLALALFLYWLARRISLPLEEMRRGAEELASGGNNPTPLFENADFCRETADLARSLNFMAMQIHKRMAIIIRQRNELEAVFESMTDGIMAIGNDHTIIRINQAAMELFQVKEKDVHNTPLLGIVRPVSLQRFILEALDTPHTVEEELDLNLNEREVCLRVRSVPLYSGPDERIGRLVVINDLTRINRLETIRRNFVANVSHELKTPITAIRGYVETLLDGACDDPAQNRKFLQIVDRQSRRLDAIVDDLLYLARIENRGREERPRCENELIEPIINAAVQTCSPLAGRKKITISVSCHPDLEVPVNRAMLEQALINLISNGITYSPERKEIRIEANIRPDREKGTALVIRVADQGCGIPAQHLDRIFERFYRCDKARSRENGGTGLGLAIVKHIAQFHDGRVDVESEPGQGSVFSLIIPVQG